MPRPRTRRRERRSIPQGRAYIYSTFNNTLVSITDPEGNVVASTSSGTAGFRGSRKRHGLRRPTRGRTGSPTRGRHGYALH